MRNFQVEVWASGDDYEAGHDGVIITVRAKSPSHAEEKALRGREYDVAESCVFRGLSNRGLTGR